VLAAQPSAGALQPEPGSGRDGKRGEHTEQTSHAVRNPAYRPPIPALAGAAPVDAILTRHDSP
jgi:hypothetical protein